MAREGVLAGASMNFLQKLKKAFGGAASEQRQREKRADRAFHQMGMEMAIEMELQIQDGVKAGIAHQQAEKVKTDAAERIVETERVVETVGAGTSVKTAAPKTAHFKTRSN